MDFVKLLRSAEELVFLLGSWLIFVPKTIGRVFISAEWTYTYVRQQHEIEEAEDRYLGYFSPVLFWLATSVLPYLVVLERYARRGHIYGPSIFDLSIEQKFWAVTLFVIGLPLGFSLLHNLFRGNKIDRPTLQPMFHTQCYCVGLFSLSLVPAAAYAFAPPGQAGGFMARHCGWIALLGLLWFLQTEFRVVRVALGKGSLSTAALTIVYVLLSFIATLVIALLAMYGVSILVGEYL